MNDTTPNSGSTPPSSDTCDRCGATIRVGEWPFCPHGFGQSNVIGDEIDEWNENVGDHPVHFTSRIEKRRYLNEKGLEEFVRHVPRPDGKRPSTTRWI